MRKLPMRQIHLDFHTSPHIGGIGDLFNGDEFGETLKNAHVEWINLFAKCHHGMFYYRTELGTVHPHLGFELLKGQIEACRSRGIKFGIYTCVGWSEDQADKHPEWMEISPEGVIGVKKPFTIPSWQKLCLNNKVFRQAIKNELKEAFELFRPDGFWIDIIFQLNCLCKTCMPEMLKLGMDPQCPADVGRHDKLVTLEFMADINKYIKTFAPDVAIYFNCHPYEMDTADDMAIAGRNKQALCDYIDIESLPSDAWGYSHFPIAVNYVNRHDKDLNMMNGKFHTSWGDFGSLRNKKALEYECFRALANGAGSCVGDQLHPSGRLDPEVYKRIGEVFAMLEEREPWSANTKKVAQAGVFCARSSLSAFELMNADLVDEGVYRILSELKYTFDFLDFTDDISGYELIILPDGVQLSDGAAKKVNAYIADGGKVIVTGESGVRDGRFIIDNIGVEYAGSARYKPRYMRITGDMFPDVQPMDYVMYEQGAEVRATEGTQVIAPIVNPYFNRDYFRFCSHRQTPPELDATEFAGITRNENIIYIAQPMFSEYANSRCMICRDILGKLILDLGVKPFIKTDLPSFAETTLRAKDGKLILHILNYIIERKGRRLDTIEESIPLYGRRIGIRLDGKPAALKLAPSMEGLDFDWDGEYAWFTPEKIGGYEIVEITL